MPTLRPLSGLVARVHAVFRGPSGLGFEGETVRGVVGIFVSGTTLEQHSKLLRAFAAWLRLLGLPEELIGASCTDDFMRALLSLKVTHA